MQVEDVEAVAGDQREGCTEGLAATGFGPRQVVMEASGFWPAFARAVQPEADKLVMVHPLRVKAIRVGRG